MDPLDRPTIQQSAAELADELKTRSPDGAAAKLSAYGGAEIAGALTRLSPAFAQDVLGALSDEVRERAFAAAPVEATRQWQRNALYDAGTVGRMMEPVVAAFPPEQTVGDAVDTLREMVKSTFITYVWVVDPKSHLQGIVTMRDLLFSDRERKLADVMLKNAFTLHASMPL